MMSCLRELLFSLGTSTKLHFCQLDVPDYVGICWLSTLGFLQVVECFVIISQVVKGHSRSVQGLEVLSFLLEDLQTIFFHPFIVHQLRLKKACCQAVVTIHLDALHRPPLLLRYPGMGTGRTILLPGEPLQLQQSPVILADGLPVLLVLVALRPLAFKVHGAMDELARVPSDGGGHPTPIHVRRAPVTCWGSPDRRRSRGWDRRRSREEIGGEAGDGP